MRIGVSVAMLGLSFNTIKSDEKLQIFLSTSDIGDHRIFPNEQPHLELSFVGFDECGPHLKVSRL